MEKNKDYYAKLGQEALDAGMYEQAEAFLNQAKSLADSNQTTPENPEEDSGGFLSGTVEAVTGVGVGAMNAVKEAGDTIDAHAAALANKLGDVVVYDDIPSDAYKGYEDAEGVHLFNVFGKKIKWATGDGIQELKKANLYNMLKIGEDVLDPVTYDLEEAREDGVITGTAGEMSAGISNFVAGWAMLGGFKSAGVVGGLVKGSAVDYTFIDEHEGRLSDLAIEFGLENELTLYLASDKDDSVFEGKLKNAIEGAGIGLAVEGVIFFAKAIKAAKRGDTKAAEEFMEKGREAAFKDPSEVEITDVDGTPIKMDNPKAANDVVEEGVERSVDDLVNQPTVTSNPIIDEIDAVKVGFDTPKNPLRSDAANDIADEVTPESVRADSEAASQKKRAENKDFRDAETGKTTKQISWAEQMETGQRLIRNLSKGIAEEDGSVGVVKLAKSLLELRVPVKEWDSFREAAESLQKQIEAEMVRLANSPAGKQGDAAVKKQLQSLGEAVTYASAARGAAISQSARNTQAAKKFKSKFGYDVTFDFNADGIITAIRNAETKDVIGKGHKHFDDGIEILNEMNLNFMLSGMGTQLVNMVSNAMIALLHPLEMYIGATKRAVFEASKGNLKGATQAFTLPNRQMIGLWKYQSIAAKYAAKAFRAGRNILDEEGMVTEMIGDSGSDVAIGKGNATNLKEFAEGNAWDKFGNIVRLPSRSLLAGDEFFKQLNFRAKAYSLIAEELQPKFGHLDANSFDAMVESRVDAAFKLQKSSKTKAEMTIQAGEDPKLIDITQRAIQQARINTFTNDLGGYGKGLQKLVSTVPPLRQILPFIRTPINILKYPLKRTFGFHKFSREMQEKLARGGADRDEAHAMLATGTGLWIGAAMMTYNQKAELDDGKGGKISVYRYQGTWAGLTPSRKQALKAAGAIPNSYVTEDGEFVQYSRFDPISLFVGVAADVRDIQAASGEDAGTLDVIGSSIMAIMNVFKDKSYTRGLTDALKAFDEPEGFLGHWMNNKAASYVPSAVSQFKTDEFMREVRGPLDAIINRIPMLSSTLEPQFDPFGRPVLATTGLLVKTKYSNDDMVSREILSLIPSLGELPDKKGGVDLTSDKYMMTNSAGETVTAYYRFNEILGESKLIEKLEWRIKSDRYQDRSGVGISTVDGVMGNEKEDLLQSIVKKERDRAWKQLLTENETLKARVNAIEKAAKKASKGKEDEARDLLGILK